jgi:uncharacterized membrane protein
MDKVKLIFITLAVLLGLFMFIKFLFVVIMIILFMFIGYHYKQNNK